MQTKYGLVVDSRNDKDVPIARMGSKVVYLHEANDRQEPKTIIESKSYDILPVPFVKKSMNLRYFLAGASGCGKSTLASKILEEYHKLYPQQEIIILSALSDDPAYDENKKLMNVIKRFDIRDDLDDIEMEDFSHSMCVFDDSALTNQKQHKALYKIKDSILSTGRHNDVDSIVIRQDLLGGKESKFDHLQSQYLCFFPHCGNDEELYYTFEKKYRYDKNTIKKLMNGNSRWVCLSKHHPRYMIASNKVELL